jgi:hypothetical protein
VPPRRGRRDPFAEIFDEYKYQRLHLFPHQQSTMYSSTLFLSIIALVGVNAAPIGQIPQQTPSMQAPIGTMPLQAAFPPAHAIPGHARTSTAAHIMPGHAHPSLTAHAMPGHAHPGRHSHLPPAGHAPASSTVVPVAYRAGANSPPATQASPSQMAEMLQAQQARQAQAQGRMNLA